MTNLEDAWFLLRQSAYPVASGVVFFLLGLWFAFLLWHRWVRHLHEWQQENKELEGLVTSLKGGQTPSSSRSARELQRRLQAFFSGRLDPDDAGPKAQYREAGISEGFVSGVRHSRSDDSHVRSLIAAAAAAFAARTKALDGKA